jgi:streptogramin lyase
MVLVMGLLAPAAGAQITYTQTNFLTPFPTAKTDLSPYGSGALSGGDPAGLSWGINSKGVVVLSATYANFLMQINAATGTLASPIPTESTQPNAVSNPSGVAIDGNNYLYVSNMYTNVIARIPMNSDGSYTIPSDPTASGSGLPTCAGTGSTTSSMTVTATSSFNGTTVTQTLPIAVTIRK